MNKRFANYTRRECQDIGRPMHLRLRDCHNDELQLRALMLKTNGRETVVNWIYAAAGLPNRY